MKSTKELISRVKEYENAGYTTDQAIELVKIERIIILNNLVKSIKNTAEYFEFEFDTLFE
ncbi:MAG: hypothetical protein K0R31_1295 [Clostridiales bacterium]|jgi:hypothetical protein|nr:hypothetical protein [Clostridiales bacterium]MDF2859166.1 hypothetical protein [Neobacillus sp.]